MGAIALIAARTERVTPERDLAPMLDAMAHRGPDGARATETAFASLGCQHFWTTPEAVGEQQPLVADDGMVLAFDGRLDNRDEISRALPGGAGACESETDAALVLAAYRAWGEEAFARLLGPFVAVVIEPATRRVLLARDVLGGRTLSYHLDADRLVTASEAQAVITHPSVPNRLDAGRVATYFTAGELRGPSTFFATVRELPAGHVLRVTPSATDLHPFDALRRPATVPAADEWAADEWTAAFRRRFDRAVACRLRAPRTPGVLLSGGLDSAPIAASAAPVVANATNGQRVPTFSWVFDHHPASDERRFLRPLEQLHRLDPTHLICDDAGPLGDLATWPVHPATPEQNPYRRFHQRVYRAAGERGVPVLLSGMCGDQLYAGTEHWLADLVAAGAWRDLVAELAQVYRTDGWFRRTTVRAFVPSRWAWRRRRHRSPPWMTAEALRLLPESDQPMPPPWVRRPRQYDLLAGAMNGHGFGVEAFHAHRYGVEVRHPLRDRRLIELMLVMPTSALFAGGVRRPVVRNAFRDRLPASILERRDKATFEPILRGALFGRAASLVSELLEAPGATWHHYVRRDWLRPASLSAESDATRLLVAWLCLGFELWRSRVHPT